MMKKEKKSRKNSASKERRRSASSSANGASLSVAVSKRDEEVAQRSLEGIRDRLWFALPTVHAAFVEACGEDADVSTLRAHLAEEEVEGEENGPRRTYTRLTGLELPWEEMKLVVHCLYMATHSNPTTEDADTAVAGEVGTAEAPKQTMYTHTDLFSFLDELPAKWIPEYETIRQEIPDAAAAERTLKLFNNQLIDCVTTDEAPIVLLEPAQALRLSNHQTMSPGLPKAVRLRNPVCDFVPCATHSTYPVSFTRLWAAVCTTDNDVLSLEDFSRVVVWFLMLHYTNATKVRSATAAAYLYYAHLDEKGQLGREEFRRAVSDICRRYARRRDASEYLAQLLNLTAVACGVAAEEATAHLSLEGANMNLLESQLPRKPLDNPEDLYMPDELRPYHRTLEVLPDAATPNRIVIYGDRALGKTRVGQALAKHLHCVHLDVLELATHAFLTASAGVAAGIEEEYDEEDGEEGKATVSLEREILACVEERRAIPLATQAALIRRELAKESTRVFRGFVFSDTVATLPGGEGAAAGREELEQFLTAAGFTEESVPAVFLELTQANTALAAEWRERSDGALAEALAVQEAKMAAETEKARRELEAQEMRQSCKEIIDHFNSLQQDGTDAPEEEMEQARQQASEAEEILAQLDAEKEEEEAAAAATMGSGTGEADEESPEEQEAHQQRDLEVLLQHLIQLGRSAFSGSPTDHSTTWGDAAMTQAQKLAAAVPCWSHPIFAAEKLGRFLSMDATSSAEDIIAYVEDTLRLCPTVLPFNPALVNAGGEGDEAQAEAIRAADEEERGRILEAAAGELGCKPSPLWKRFCPVTYCDEGVLVEGAACFMCVYRDCCYYMTSAARLERFMENPPRYLNAQVPVSDQQRVLFIVDDSMQDVLPTAAAVDNSEVASVLAETLQLTKFSLAQYSEHVGAYCELRNQRAAANAARKEYETKEWAERDERLEKRLKAESKKRKPASAAKPKGKGKGTNSAQGAGPKVSITEPTPPAKSPKPAAPLPTPTEREMERRIAEAKDKFKDAVPVFVTMASWDDVEGNTARVEMLLEERCLPECVVVLKGRRPPVFIPPVGGAASEEAGEEAAEADFADADGTAVSATTEALLEKIREASKAAPRVGNAASWKRKEGDGRLPEQAVTVHVIETFLSREDGLENEAAHSGSGEDAVAATAAGVDLGEKGDTWDVRARRLILQQVHPVSPVPGEGAVDEELGMYSEEDEEEEEEEEEEMGDEDGDEDGEGRRRGPPVLGMAPVPPKPDPRLRPRRRFLNQFGATLEYCPVTLLDQRLLVRGLPDVCLEFLGELYCFASEECKNTFAADPLRYAASHIPRDVPPRLWLIGARLSGKRTLASGLRREYGVHNFHYDRKFFEQCIEAAQSAEGAVVNDIFIPHHDEHNEYVKKAAAALKAVRDFAADQERQLKLRSEAEATMAERERKEEERAEREAAGEYFDDEDEEDEEGAFDEEKEAALQEQLEFEPEDPELAQERLNEAYLRMASYVTRFEPFESEGYAMVSQAFSPTDIDILFSEGCIPEAVIHLELKPELFTERQAAKDQAAAAAEKAKEDDIANSSATANTQRRIDQKESAAEERRRQRALRRWRRRNIGADDPEEVSEEDADAEEEGARGAAGGGDGAGAQDGGEEPEVDSETARAEELDAITEFIEVMKERLVPVFKPNANVEQEALLRATGAALARHLTNRLSFFYAVEVVEHETAIKMLEAGKVDLSSYGYMDPVALWMQRSGQRRLCTWPHREQDDDEAAFAVEQLSSDLKSGADGKGTSSGDDDDDDDGGAIPSPSAAAANAGEGEDEEEEEMSEIDPDELEEMRERLERRQTKERKLKAPRCGILHGRLYIFKDDDNLLRFLKNPLTYAEEAPPLFHLPISKPVLSVFADDGYYHEEPYPQKSSQARKARAGGVAVVSTQVPVAEAIASCLDAVLITEASLLTWASGLPDVFGSFAAAAISAAMEGGADESLISDLLVAKLSSAEVRRRGAVLLNLPRTASQVEVIAGLRDVCPQIHACVKMTAKPPAAGVTSTIEWADEIQAALNAQPLVPVEVVAPSPHSARDPANLPAIVHRVDDIAHAERDAQLRSWAAFPSNLDSTHHPVDLVHANMSPYRWYCPYSWVEEADLEAIDSSAPPYGARYLGEYYFFKKRVYLVRFLLNPQEVADPSTLRPLPPALPRIVTDVEEERLRVAPDGKLELVYRGCCPVLLYDTRERLGLCGVIEPLAKVGSLDCVVEYDGEYYVCFDEVSQQRFMRRPWQYVEGASMPSARKCPLTVNAVEEEEYVAGKAVGDEEFMRRRLYDAVAYAMVEVAKVRPRYPGLTEEESAMKFIALHMKAHRDDNDEIQQQQYDENLAIFTKRATLYKAVVEPITAADGKPDAATFDELCADYDAMQKGVKCVADLGHLRN